MFLCFCCCCCWVCVCVCIRILFLLDARMLSTNALLLTNLNQITCFPPSMSQVETCKFFCYVYYIHIFIARQFFHWFDYKLTVLHQQFCLSIDFRQTRRASRPNIKLVKFDDHLAFFFLFFAFYSLEKVPQNSVQCFFIFTFEFVCSNQSQIRQLCERVGGREGWGGGVTEKGWVREAWSRCVD